MGEHSRSIPDRDAEAEAIATHARAGRLDVSDPKIRREATQAVRQAARAEVWGDRGSRRTVLWVIGGGLLALTVWVVALVAPLLVLATP